MSADGQESRMATLCPVCGKKFEDSGAVTAWEMMYRHQLATHEKPIRTRSKASDPAPIIASIEEAAKILRARGVKIDLVKEMPHAGDQNYWMELVHLHEKLWSMVYANYTKTKACKVVKIHDDGDATLNCGGIEHVATTEGKLYKEV